MSNHETSHGKHTSVETHAAPKHSGAPRQFAHGGNGSPGLPQPPPAAPLALDDQNPPAGDSLVMLQLASFEGRAL